jgi:outer membrane protein OmpA-like peptidoglycan-associated protein
MNRKLGLSLIGLTAAALGIGCAHNPPKELLEARAEYEKTSQGPAAKYNPAELHEAKKTLDHANQAFNNDPGSDYTRDVAYIALRKVEIAEADGKVEQANQERAQADQRVAQLTQQQLAKTKDQLAQTNQELAAQRQASQDAMANLSRLGNVREDSRGTVITLTGGVLFASGKSTLLPDARGKLDQVAEALKNANGQFVVEGHTDSRGSARLNQRLSERRAETVRNYLIERGVPPERISAEGFGNSRPIASNRTAEGRANNRRVEIVVQRAYGGSGNQAPGTKDTAATNTPATKDSKETGADSQR